MDKQIEFLIKLHQLLDEYNAEIEVKGSEGVDLDGAGMSITINGESIYDTMSLSTSTIAITDAIKLLTWQRDEYYNHDQTL